VGKGKGSYQWQESKVRRGWRQPRLSGGGIWGGRGGSRGTGTREEGEGWNDQGS